MNKRDEFKIELISNIDEEIIEKESVKRFSLMRKNRYSRKKIAGWCSVAACFLLTVSVVLAMLQPLLSKQAPVYEGMTVSSTMPELHGASGATFNDVARLMSTLSTAMIVSRGNSDIFRTLTATDGTVTEPDDPENAGNATEDTDSTVTETDDPENAGNATEDTGDENGEIGDTGTTEGESGITLPEVDGEDRLLYYARKNQDIYITVHINNPASYEILSFTLNGTKYQSYMFEDGSNSEALVLKVNVGDTEGIVEYTIDAIKYVDGTEIKDVRMDGERTVKVGVYSEDPEDHPTVQITDRVIGFEAVSFGAVISDKNSMLEASDGKLFVYLYKGDELISSTELRVGDNNPVSFDGLEQGVEYLLTVVAHYDSFDGNGFSAHKIHEEKISAKSYVEIKDLHAPDKSSIAFDITIAPDGNVTVTSVELINASGEVEYTAGADTRSFDGLRLGYYTVRVKYTYGDDNKPGSTVTEVGIENTYLGSFGDIMDGAQIYREYYDDVQKYDPTMNDYRYHFGVDIVNTQPVYSQHDGEVVNIYQDMVSVRYEVNKEIFDYLYEEILITELVVGQKVSVGDLIGFRSTEAEVRSAFTGIVKTVGVDTVIITDKSGRLAVVYASLDNIPDDLTVGSTVKRGDVIGTASDTYFMESAQDYHVHIEVWISDEIKDPLEYFDT